MTSFHTKVLSTSFHHYDSYLGLKCLPRHIRSKERLRDLNFNAVMARLKKDDYEYFNEP